MAKKDVKIEKINQEEFKFVARGEKIYDKKFETKPIGYFKDAMMRFVRNRANVTASIILLVIILCSVFIPILSPKNAEVQESRLQYLPPRWPLLENIGIFDGRKNFENQPVDESTIDPETGLGLPFSVPEEYIYMDTLTNELITCNDKDTDLCVGGVNVLTVDPGKDKVVIESNGFDTDDDDIPDDRTNSYITLDQANDAYFYISVSEANFTEGSELNVYLKATRFSADYFETPILTITEPGEYTISPYDILGSTFTVSMIKVEFVSVNRKDTVSLDTIAVYDNTQEAPTYEVNGYTMANWYNMTVEEGAEDTGGTWQRKDGQSLVSSFEYDAYAKAFGSYYENSYAKSKFDIKIAEYADACAVTWTNPDDANNWGYAEGCPVEEVLAKVGVVVIDGVEYYSYDLIANYGLMNGYDEMPYFIFGTTGNGKDLFKLIWIGTRTSLLLGLLVSAINITIGIVYGAVSGYYGGLTDLLMQRFAEIVGRIPWLVTLSIFIALYGPGQVALIGVLIISGWIGVAGVTRTQFYRYKGREYVLASRTLGAGDGRLIFRHILPNGIGTIITSSILSIPAVIFTESTLSFLGFGIGHGTTLNLFGLELTGVSIGVLLSDGRTRLLYEPYLTLWPAFVISILMITFNMFGNALRDAFNPALRGTE